MKFQTYNEKMDAVLASVITVESKNPLGVLIPKPLVLNFDELHRILIQDNVIAVKYPRFAFNLSTMKVENEDVMQKLAKNILFTNSVMMHIGVTTETKNDIEEFEFFTNDDDIFFFYSGMKAETSTGSQYQLRYAKIEREKIKKAIEKYEAIQRINSTLSINIPVSKIRKYVRSPQFAIDMELAAISTQEIVKEINQTNTIEEKSPRATELDAIISRNEMIAGLSTE